MIIGLFMLTINIVSLIAFFCTSSLNEYIDEYIAKVLESIVYSCGMLAALTGICQVHGLQNTAEAVHASVDRVLLYFGLFFVFAHTSFIIPVGLLVPPSDVTRIPGALHVITGIMNILQASLQVVFISLLLTKTIFPGESRHPGRQVCTMLVILNFGLWLEDTFVMQKYRASMAEREFYGITAWVPIQRITLPVCIFFRFHSLVMLVDIWKNSYKVIPCIKIVLCTKWIYIKGVLCSKLTFYTMEMPCIKQNNCTKLNLYKK